MAYSKMRNLDERPYSREEAEGAKYLSDLTGIGGGDDPVGFLIASHRELVRQRIILAAEYPEIFEKIARVSGEESQIEPASPEAAEQIGRSEPPESPNEAQIL